MDDNFGSVTYPESTKPMRKLVVVLALLFVFGFCALKIRSCNRIMEAKTQLVIDTHTVYKALRIEGAERCLEITRRFLTERDYGRYEQRLDGLRNPPIGLLLIPNDFAESVMWDLAHECDRYVIRAERNSVSGIRARELAIQRTPINKIWEIRDAITDLSLFADTVSGNNTQEERPDTLEEIEAARRKLADLKAATEKKLYGS